ncbi:MAG: Gfo/Idh/MocA family oxidoreductase [Clostridia bacterium]|nr:Gfo/Idh/MocA family oxidoreductase [Clostridia bacterium]
MTRFALVGGGWRAEFFARIALALPDRFQLTATYLRDPLKRADWQRRFGCRMAESPEDLLADKPDYLVVSIAKKANPDVLIRMMDLGLPILCETPPFITPEGMVRAWEAAKAKGVMLQVAEQYPDWPLYSAWQKAVDEGMLGEVSNINISAVHSYHAISLIRRFLNVGFENVTMTGCRHFFPVRATDSRDGLIPHGEVSPARRDRLTMVFDSGKTAFFDFSNVQYHSYIRTRQLTIQGDQGEIDDMTLRCMNADGQPLCLTLQRHDLGLFNNNHYCPLGLQLGDRWLWRNEFLYGSLNDDELAIAAVMERMGRLVRGESDEPAYSWEDGLQDAYLALVIAQALADPWKSVRSETQPWAK